MQGDILMWNSCHWFSKLILCWLMGVRKIVEADSKHTWIERYRLASRLHYHDAPCKEKWGKSKGHLQNAREKLWLCLLVPLRLLHMNIIPSLVDFPLQVCVNAGSATSVNREARILRVVKILRILKITRILKAFKVIEWVSPWFGACFQLQTQGFLKSCIVSRAFEDIGVVYLGASIFKIIRLACIALFCVHLFACLFFRVKLASAESLEDVVAFYAAKNVADQVR